jgi:predicted Zn-dependent protease
MDAGKLDDAVAKLEKLHAQHPNNAVIIHELGLAYRLQKRPKQAIDLLMPLRAALPLDALAGLASALDEAGEKAKAQAFLREEIKRHPKAGILYSELATSLLAANKLQEALELYEKSIEVDPAFPASYFHAAELYAMTPSRGMALLYGETFRILEPTTERSGKNARLMLQVCKDAVRIEDTKKRKSTAKIALADSNIVMNASGSLPIVNQFELAFGPGLAIATMNGLKLKTLHAARRALLDTLNGSAKNTGLAAMPIMRWLRDLDAAGYLEAYDYWLFGPGMQDEAVAWFNSHQAAAEAMAIYLIEHPLFPAK